MGEWIRNGVETIGKHSIAIVIILTLITIACVLIYVFADKDSKSIKWLKNKHIFSIVSGVLLTISLAFSVTTNEEINWLISCIFALITIVCVVVEKESKYYKTSYHFNDQYKGIQTEYDHIRELLAEKQIENDEKNCLINQYVNHSLENTRYNMSLTYSYFLKELIYHTENNDESKNKNAKQKRKDFFKYNFNNAHDYLYLSKHKDINIEIFANIFYNIYERVRKDFLAPLVFETNTKVPEFIAKELDSAISGIPNVKQQLNTSIYTMKGFYDLYKAETPRKIAGVKVRRIFIYKESDIDKYKIIRGDNVSGINNEIHSVKIPLLLWVLEWHKKNDWYKRLDRP